MAATYDQLVDYFIKNIPYGDVEPFSPQFNDLFNKWWGAVKSAQGAPDNDSIDLSNIPADLTAQFTNSSPATVPLEQDLLNTVVNHGSADAANDTNRATDVSNVFSGLAPAYANNLGLINSIGNGSLLASEQGALGTATDSQLKNLADQLGIVADSNGRYTADQLAHLAAYQQGIAGNIDTETGALQTALNPVLAARLKAAGASEAAVNLASQDQRDQLNSQDALKGFVGGSSTLDQSLARASIAGRQQAAGVQGDAVLANATDQSALDKYGANQRRTLADSGTTGTRTINDAASQTQNLLDQYGASQGRTIKDANATGNFTLGENNINRQLAGLALPTQYATDYFNAKTAGDNYANTGLNRYLSQLNWFTSNGAPPTSQPITTTSTDNGLATLGTGVAGIGMSLMNSPAWANLFNSNPGAGASTTYADYLKNNPTSTAAIGQ